MVREKNTAKAIDLATRQPNQGVGDYLLASKRCEIIGLEKLLGMGNLLATISHLVHALQIERGASNMYLGSGGMYCADLRQQQIIAATNAEKEFRLSLEQAANPHSGQVAGDSRLFSRIAYAIHGLDELRTIREGICHLTIAPETVIDGYSELIQSLLAIVYETADSAADPDVSRVLVAMFHLMQGKELAGQERATGSAGFAIGHFDNNFSKRLRRLIDSQERCFRTFINFADSDTIALWQSLEQGESTAALEKLRRIAFASLTDDRADTELSNSWFKTTSARIDRLKDIEHHLEQTLSTLCQRKIREAREEMDCHRLHIDAVSRQGSEPTFAVFFSARPDASAENINAYDTGCAGPQLGRSLFDLVQLQDKRLQSMSEELEAAKAALSERKLIEKTKGLIMKSRGVDEEEAYRFMRQIAMAQNRRLAEIARDALAMADLLT